MGGMFSGLATESREGRPAALDTDRRIEAGVTDIMEPTLWWIFEEAEKRTASGLVRGRKCGWYTKPESSRGQSIHLRTPNGTIAEKHVLGRMNTGRTFCPLVSQRSAISFSASLFVVMYRAGMTGRKMSSAEM